MARRTFEVIDVTEILMHWHAQRCQPEFASSVGVDRKTVRKYTAPAKRRRHDAGRSGAERAAVG